MRKPVTPAELRGAAAALHLAAALHVPALICSAAVPALGLTAQVSPAAEHPGAIDLPHQTLLLLSR